MGHPHELLTNKESYFKQLVSQTGSTISASLQETASEVSRMNLITWGVKILNNWNG